MITSQICWGEAIGHPMTIDFSLGDSYMPLLAKISRPKISFGQSKLTAAFSGTWRISMLEPNQSSLAN